MFVFKKKWWIEYDVEWFIFYVYEKCIVFKKLFIVEKFVN